MKIASAIRNAAERHTPVRHTVTSLACKRTHRVHTRRGGGFARIHGGGGHSNVSLASEHSRRIPKSLTTDEIICAMTYFNTGGHNA